MKSTKPEPSFLQPVPLAGFTSPTVFCIPFDPSGIIRRRLEKEAIHSKVTPMGTFFRIRAGVVVHGCIGAPLTVISLERLIASGAEKIIFLGFCGSLNPQSRLFMPVIPAAAFSQEGTSRHYIPEKKIFHPFPELRESLEADFQNQSLSFAAGTVVSTDAPFRETKTWLMHNLESGIDYVDMELSSVFALAEFRKVKAAGALIISDELFGERWNRGFHRPEMEQSIIRHFFSLLDLSPAAAPKEESDNKQ